MLKLYLLKLGVMQHSIYEEMTRNSYKSTTSADTITKYFIETNKLSFNIIDNLRFNINENLTISRYHIYEAAVLSITNSDYHQFLKTPQIDVKNISAELCNLFFTPPENNFVVSESFESIIKFFKSVTPPPKDLTPEKVLLNNDRNIHIADYIAKKISTIDKKKLSYDAYTCELYYTVNQALISLNGEYATFNNTNLIAYSISEFLINGNIHKNNPIRINDKFYDYKPYNENELLAKKEEYLILLDSINKQRDEPYTNENITKKL